MYTYFYCCTLLAGAPSTNTPVTVSTAEADYEVDTDEEEDDDSSYQTEVVNCSCGFNEEDGLMIQVLNQYPRSRSFTP